MNILRIVLFSFLVLGLSYHVKADMEQECNCKFVVGKGDKENPLTWNQKDGVELECDKGTAYDCRKECDESVTTVIPQGTEAEVSGILPDFIITAITPQGEITNTQSTAGVTIPEGFFEVTSNEVYPIGTKIFVEEFTTNPDGSFVVTGTVELP